MGLRRNCWSRLRQVLAAHANRRLQLPGVKANSREMHVGAEERADCHCGMLAVGSASSTTVDDRAVVSCSPRILCAAEVRLWVNIQRSRRSVRRVPGR